VKKSQAGAGVAVKIEHAVYQSAKMYGRHFDDKDDILSHVTRQSIDVLKVCWLRGFFCFKKRMTTHLANCCRLHSKMMCRKRNGFLSEPSSL
jgi:hypothetical protein